MPKILSEYVASLCVYVVEEDYDSSLGENVKPFLNELRELLKKHPVTIVNDLSHCDYFYFHEEKPDHLLKTMTPLNSDQTVEELFGDRQRIERTREALAKNLDSISDDKLLMISRILEA